MHICLREKNKVKLYISQCNFLNNNVLKFTHVAHPCNGLFWFEAMYIFCFGCFISTKTNKTVYIYIEDFLKKRVLVFSSFVKKYSFLKLKLTFMFNFGA